MGDYEGPLTEDEAAARAVYFVSQSCLPAAGRLGAVMALIAGILGVSLHASALVAGVLLARIEPDRHSGGILVILFLAWVGGIIGAVAGAAREIMSAQRQKASNSVAPRASRTGLGMALIGHRAEVAACTRRIC